MFKINKGSKIGITGCSNGTQKANKNNIDRLCDIIKQRIGLEPVLSDCIYETDSYFSGTAMERAEALMNLYRDKDVKAIFDISGGDVANEVLEYLDFDVIRDNPKIFYGYSDLTTVINAIYSRTGNVSGLYQIRNLISEDSDSQINNFKNSIINGTDDLFDIDYQFIQEGYMEGIVTGGNIRCLLKLAGTEYMPDFAGKILLLEGLNSSSQQVATYLCQLRQMGVFNKIEGILLGTFTKLDREIFVPSVEELVQRYAGHDIPIARTMDIGHGSDSKCIMIGKFIKLQEMYH